MLFTTLLTTLLTTLFTTLFTTLPILVPYHWRGQPHLGAYLTNLISPGKSNSPSFSWPSFMFKQWGLEVEKDNSW
ncbi:hypothetical protein C8J55DRAFT_518273 [Lentinula edodes]|uniref:Uncharacterized protein n=1 Tax=Lentinula lateritia TaxID=40482 RepID=A0A9W9A536_9AGAR|nr:hypothetical protein C8J55DRAFT_518273 [Lentinula edodes]